MLPGKNSNDVGETVQKRGRGRTRGNGGNRGGCAAALSTSTGRPRKATPRFASTPQSEQAHLGAYLS